MCDGQPAGLGDLLGKTEQGYGTPYAAHICTQIRQHNYSNDDTIEKLHHERQHDEIRRQQHHTDRHLGRKQTTPGEYGRVETLLNRTILDLEMQRDKCGFNPAIAFAPPSTDVHDDPNDCTTSRHGGSRCRD